jgi:putative redox protein
MSSESLKETTAMPVVGKPPSKVTVTWAGDHRFDGQRQSGGPAIRMDASGTTGPSPVDALLCALAGCTGVDVVDILAKRRTPVQALSVDVEGERFAGVPGRVTSIKLHYRIIGAEVERTHAERAIELAVTKYCSVRDSLDPNMAVTWALELNGAHS